MSGPIVTSARLCWRDGGGIIQLLGHPIRKAGNKAVTIGHLEGLLSCMTS
jgi:hypothetical protein